MTASVTLCSDGTVAMRLRERAADEPRPAFLADSGRSSAGAVRPTEFAGRPSCDLGDALAFALRHAEPKADAKRIELTSTAEPNVAAVCDRQVGRRILHHLLDSALNGSAYGSAVHVLVRRLKGVVLLRVSSAAAPYAASAESESDDRLDVATLRDLVDAVGGTLVVARKGDDIALCVRLDPAEDAADEREEEDKRAGAR